MEESKKTMIQANEDKKKIVKQKDDLEEQVFKVEKQVKVLEDGIYRLFFVCTTNNPAQFSICVNGVPIKILRYMHVMHANCCCTITMTLQKRF